MPGQNILPRRWNMRVRWMGSSRTLASLMPSRPMRLNTRRICQVPISGQITWFIRIRETCPPPRCVILPHSPFSLTRTRPRFRDTSSWSSDQRMSWRTRSTGSSSRDRGGSLLLPRASQTFRRDQVCLCCVSRDTGMRVAARPSHLAPCRARSRIAYGGRCASRRCMTLSYCNDTEWRAMKAEVS